jgi:hypothetical protein
LVVENMDPVAVAAERGTSRLMLTELPRDAVDALAVEYEDVKRHIGELAGSRGRTRTKPQHAADPRPAPCNSRTTARTCATSYWPVGRP